MVNIGNYKIRLIILRCIVFIIKMNKMISKVLSFLIIKQQGKLSA